MKILYITSTGSPGGASVALYNLVQGLYNDNDIFFVFPNKGAFSKQIEELGINCYYIPFTLTIYPRFRSIKFPFLFAKNLLLNYLAYKSLLSIVKEINPDIIHTNVGPLDIGLKVAKKCKIKHVWHLREYQDLDFGVRFFPSKKNFIKKLSDNNNYSIAITKDVFQYWKLGQKDKVIYDGVIYDHPHEYISKKENYFLFVGRIEEAKGLLPLLKVFEMFTRLNKEFSLLITGNKGSSNYYKRCLDFVKSANLEDKVSFLGQRGDVYQLMEVAKALIVPSRFEGFGFITTEAMYNHCLVIGKNTAGTKEQFDNGFLNKDIEIGFRFDTEEELLKILNITVNLSEDKYKEFTKNAYETVMGNYTVQKHIDQVKSFYNEIIN